jgi:hypothetical protein
MRGCAAVLVFLGTLMLGSLGGCFGAAAIMDASRDGSLLGLAIATMLAGTVVGALFGAVQVRRMMRRRNPPGDEDQPR